ncbi:MAG TPA: GNAT family N-acetyltransferase [Tepidisphaeraceae bacterium]|nr:GNAT family N-acetyltransferase [Tepidisphaeraceae bacterium]
MTRVRSADGSHHHISYSAITSENADTVIGEQVAHYRALGVEVEWKAYAHDSPPDLLARVARQGFVIGPVEAVLVLDLQSPPPWVESPPTHRVVRVADAGHVTQFRAAAERIFEKDYQFTADELTQSLHDGSTQHLGYIAMDGQTPASIGRLYTHPDSAFGGLYGGGSLPDYRGRGLYRAVVAARARDAIKQGARYLIVDALPTSRPILERLGFIHLTDTWPCVLRP